MQEYPISNAYGTRRALTTRLLSFTFFLLFLTVTSSDIEAQTVTICSQSSTTYNINANPAAAVRAKLSNSANFGPTGSVCEYEFAYVTVGDNFTEAILNANQCSIWWSGFESDGSYSATEGTELLSWIDNGGLVIAGCDAPSHDPLCEILNLELSGLPSGGSGQSALNVDLQDNCFPNVAEIPISNGGGALDAFSEATASQYRVLSRLESNANGVAGLNGLATSIYGNGIFATSDVNMFTRDGSCCMTSGPFLTNSNDFFMGEGICVLARASQGEGNCIEEALEDPLNPIPTMSQWALFILALMLTNIGLLKIENVKENQLHI